MKRVLSVALAVLMMCLVITPQVWAADFETVKGVVTSLGFMSGDQNGDLQLDRNVTRAEFARLIIAASSYEGSIGGGGKTSPYTDVKASHWAVDYIKTVVNAGWMTGYSDGTFRPNEPVTLEVAASALLAMLGYTSADITGSYPSAHVAKFRSLDLDEGISVSVGQNLTRNDCMYILYNLMGASTKSGSAYGVTLGYTLNSDGKIDYDKIVDDETEGPFIAGASLALAFEPDTVYRDGRVSSLGEVEAYDVYYANAKSKTVWAYSEKAVGLYTAATPNRIDPESVTVGGKTYTLSEDAAKTKLSRQGSFTYGDTVVLLLDKNGAAADVIKAGLIEQTYYGVVTSVEYASYETEQTKAKYAYFTTILCTDGIEREFVTDTKKVFEGDLALAGYQGSSVTLKKLSANKLSGQVNAAGSQLGEYKLSEDVQILDYLKNSGYKTIYPSRLAGATLKESDILFYALNGYGEINHLILSNATGDINEYVLLTSVTENTSGGAASGSYQYLLNGESKSLNPSVGVYNAKTGPAMFIYIADRVDSIVSLTETELDIVYSTYAVSNSKQYSLYDGVQVYIENDGQYVLATVDTLAGDNNYTIKGYYDNNGYSAGGCLRVIIASENES